VAEQADMLPAPVPADFDREQLDAVPADKWARNLVEMIEVIEARHVRDGLSQAQAFRLARNAVLEVAEHQGGRQFYLPRGDTLRTALRDAEIFRKVNRSNIEELAREHGLTVSQIYRINRQQRALHVRRVQGRLFDQE
jgi:Mor family transcriptional regulator